MTAPGKTSVPTAKRDEVLKTAAKGVDASDDHARLERCDGAVPRHEAMTEVTP